MTTLKFNNFLRNINRSYSNNLLPVSIQIKQLKPDEYDKALSVLTSDVRFKLHMLLYRRVQTIWMLLSTLLCVVVPLVLANLESVLLLGACFVWLALQLFGAIISAKFRKKVSKQKIEMLSMLSLKIL